MGKKFISDVDYQSLICFTFLFFSFNVPITLRYILYDYKIKSRRFIKRYITPFMVTNTWYLITKVHEILGQIWLILCIEIGYITECESYRQ